jgi:segregation and condensation protein B
VRLEKVAGELALRDASRSSTPACASFHRSHRAQRTWLSLAALETLAIIAYRSPITLPRDSGHPGVIRSSVLKTPVSRRKLITTSGKESRSSERRSSTHRTATRGFSWSRLFGLNDLAELPRPEDLDADLAATVEAREIAPLTAQETAIHISSDEREALDRASRAEAEPPGAED